MPCAICGSPATVKSHLLPKTLVHQLRGDEKSISVVSKAAGQPRNTQGGMFDRDLMCAKHEAMTGPLDKHGVEFIRKHVSLAQRKEGALTLLAENYDPELMARFVASLIWRAVASSKSTVEGNQLGGQFQPLQDFVFEAKPMRLEVCAGISGLRADGVHGRFILPPWCTREDSQWLWRMDVAGMCFMAIAGGRGFGPTFEPMRLDRANPVRVPIFDPMDVLDWKPTRSIFETAAARELARDDEIRAKRGWKGK